MPLEPNEEKSLMRYLHGDASEEERDAIAGRLAGDEDFFLALEELETEWIDRLARGELSAVEAERARRYLRETGQDARLAVAKAIAYAADTRSTDPAVENPPLAAEVAPWWRLPAGGVRLAFAAIACCLVAVLGIVWILRTPAGLAPLDGAPAPSAGLPLAVSPVAITLTAINTRGTGAEPVSSAATPGDPLRLRFEVPEGRVFPRYRADWLGPNDAVRRSFSPLPGSPAEDGVFEVFVNAGTLSEGNHEFALYGLEPDREPVLLSYYSLTLGPLPGNTP